MEKGEISIDEYMGRRLKSVKGGVVKKGVRGGRASWNPAERSARFVMSSQSPDRDKDIIHQSGIDLKSFLNNPQALLFHNSSSWPIGSWKDVDVLTNTRPKRTEGTLKLMKEGDEPDADRAAKHIAAGTMSAVSIGFQPKLVKLRDMEQDAQASPWPGYEILECEVVECSLVPIPAQPDAMMKAALEDRTLAKDLIEEVLDNYHRFPSGLIVAREEYEKALKSPAIIPSLQGTKIAVISGGKLFTVGEKTQEKGIEAFLAELADIADAEIVDLTEQDAGAEEAAVKEAPVEAKANESLITSLIERMKSIFVSKPEVEVVTPPAKAQMSEDEKAAIRAKAQAALESVSNSINAV